MRALAQGELRVGYLHVRSQTPAYQPLTGTMEAQRVGVGRAAMGDVTPREKKIWEILREISGRPAGAKKAATFSKSESSCQSPIAVPPASAVRSEEAANLNLQGPSHGIDSNLPSLT